MRIRPPPGTAIAAGIALSAALGPASSAAGAPPVISGADGDLWNAAPSYTVSAPSPASRTRWDWRASNGQDGRATRVPFTVVLDGPFAEGQATLTVTQRPRQGVVERATRSFVIDRTPPGAVALTVPATAPADNGVPIAWSGGEPGARFTLRVRRGTGEPVQGPVETTGAGAIIVPLAAGSYVVRVIQTDAAGNPGPEAAAPLTIVAPDLPASAPAVVGAATTRPAPRAYRLPAAHASRLSPGPAARVATRRPILRWARGPAGTRLYNVQVFLVDPALRSAASAPRLLKVSSRFPRVRRLRTPLLTRGACYVWRVWPFLGSSFSARPLGLSNFCIAGAGAPP